MSAAEEIWRASEEAARALDYEAQVREADAMLELTRQPDPRTTTTQALGMPPRETPLTPYRQARTRSCPGCGYPARYVGPAGPTYCPYCGYRFMNGVPPGPGQLPGAAGPRPYERDGVLVHPGGCCCTACKPPPPPPDPADAIRAVIAEPLGLTGEQLPAYEDIPDGCCSACRRPPRAAGSRLCVYCAGLATAAREQHTATAGGGPSANRDARTAAGFLAAAAILLAAAAATAWWLAFPAAAILLVIFTAALEFTFRAGNRRRP